MTGDRTSKAPDPLAGGDFPEEEYVRDGPMREEIIRMAVEALNREHPELTADSVNRDPRHRLLFVELLRDCRPLPIIREIIADAEKGRL